MGGGRDDQFGHHLSCLLIAEAGILAALLKARQNGCDVEVHDGQPFGGQVTIKKVSFKPTSRRSSHAPAGQTGLACAGRVAKRPAERPASWHRRSAPTGELDLMCI